MAQLAVCQASIIVCEFSVQSSPQCWVFVLVLHSYLLICHSCDIILQALWTPVYVIVTLDCHVDMNGILRYFCLDHGCVVLLTTLYYFFYMYKVLLVYSFVFHLICYCCLLILNVLCFSVCCLFNAFYLLFFLFALVYASFKRCVCHSIKVTKYTC